MYVQCTISYLNVKRLISFTVVCLSLIKYMSSFCRFVKHIKLISMTRNLIKIMIIELDNNSTENRCQFLVKPLLSIFSSYASYFHDVTLFSIMPGFYIKYVMCILHQNLVSTGEFPQGVLIIYFVPS